MHCCHHLSTRFVNMNKLDMMALTDQTQRFGAGSCLHLLDRLSRCVRRSYLSSSTYGDPGDTWQLEYGRIPRFVHGTDRI